MNGPMPRGILLVAALSLGVLAGTPDARAAPPIRRTSAAVDVPARPGPLKIMPLGDSITFGTPDPGSGGYRRVLGALLPQNDYPIEFVGSRPGGDEGHPGWTILQIKNGIDTNGWLETYRPDIILLHVGTNDIRAGNAAAAPDALSALLEDILVRLPQAHVIVAQIIPFRRGPEPGHQAYNAAIPSIVAARGPRVSLVDMRSILSMSDYADGLHPNADGYDKMARVWEPAIREILSGSPGPVRTQPSHEGSAATVVTPVATSPPDAATVPVIRYVPGSTAKVEQLIGEEDKERHQPTRSRTLSRYGIEGTDLGSSFEHEGRAYFLFGDTVGRQGHALDTIATTDVSDPERGVRLDFLTAAGRYLTIQPPGISMGAFEVPVAGISLGGRMYVVVSTNHSPDRSTDRSVLTRFQPPATFQPLRTLSQLPEGHFVKQSLHTEPAPIAGLPPGGPYVFVWGTGVYRKSDAYLAIVPQSQFETGQGTRYFAGLDATETPTWSAREADAKAIVENGTLGDLSVTWCKDLGLWIMTYDSRQPRGVLFAVSRTPWGPWSAPEVIFSPQREGALGRFIHVPQRTPDDGLAGPVIGKGQRDPGAVHGGAYAPYVVERWTHVTDADLTVYYVLSTWNPYVVVLMKSRFEIR